MKRSYILNCRSIAQEGDREFQDMEQLEDGLPVIKKIVSVIRTFSIYHRQRISIMEIHVAKASPVLLARDSSHCCHVI